MLQRISSGLAALLLLATVSVSSAGADTMNDYGIYGTGSSTSMAAYSAQYNTAPSATTTNTNDGGAAAPAAAATAPATSPQPGVYAAMGDSIAAGLGLTPLANASGDDARCGRSSQGYPNLVAQKQQLRLINASCSGATVGDIVTKQAVDGPNITRQLDTAFSAGTPQLISITAGANDVHWTEFLHTCYVSNCDTKIAGAAASALTAAMKLKLAYALQAISDRSNGQPPRVVVTGYYNPISNACKGKQSYASNAEIEFLNNQRYNLNKAIRDVAVQYPFVRYASTDFTGHALCSNDSWIQGLNDTAPIHPTAMGQQHIAEAVLEAAQTN
jgi:lysophospholipase L1-like esterase